MASTDASSTSNYCASCGKEGGNLNTCNKCNMVKYCNAACKKKHRSKHKKACVRRVAELRDEELFKKPPPPVDCPICFLPMPHDARQTTFQSCCGKIICYGCNDAMIEEARGKGKIDLCAFCRTPAPISDEALIKQLQKLIEANNAYAFNQLAGFYEDGVMGMPQDFAKANELYLKAGELGCQEGYYNLGINYENGRGVEVENKKAIHFYDLAAMNGDVDARYNLGCEEIEVGKYHRAYKHFMIAATAGDKDSLGEVKKGFMDGYVTKDEYANTLRAYQSQQDEMKSDDRDKASALDDESRQYSFR